MELTTLVTNVFNNKNLKLNHNDVASILSRKDLLTQSEGLKKELSILAGNVLESKLFANKLNDKMMLATLDGQKELILTVNYQTVMNWLDDYLHVNHQQEENILNNKFEYANKAFQQTFLIITVDKLKNKLLSKGYEINITEQAEEKGINKLAKFTFTIKL